MTQTQKVRTLHTLAILIDNKPGSLARTIQTIARRGVNIESLAVGTTEDSAISRATLVVDANEATYAQLCKQMQKLINVHKVIDFDKESAVKRGLVLFKVSVMAENRSEIIELVNVFGGKIVDVAKSTMTIEATGTDEKLKAMEDLLRGYGIKEMSRAGIVALTRGARE